ncbi:hypothetical protein V2G26_001321 [Clonostachys chloroleuca]
MTQLEILSTKLVHSYFPKAASVTTLSTITINPASSLAGLGWAYLAWLGDRLPAAVHLLAYGRGTSSQKGDCSRAHFLIRAGANGSRLSWGRPSFPVSLSVSPYGP